MTAPTIGRIVHYTLSESDVDQIVAARMSGDGKGNTVREGDVVPALIVRVFGPVPVGGDTRAHVPCNLQVFLDGNHSHWATSRTEGDKPGTWAWPARV